MSAPVLETRNIAKKYGAVTAVASASFSIRPGEILGVLGPNGAGKSTIVKMVTGLVEPTRGTVLFRGEPIARDLTLYKRSLGYVPEQPDLYGFLSGWEYLELAATLRGIPRSALRAKASAMLQAYNLYPHRDTPIGAYSKGMRQRIVLIAAMMHDPDLLILDEPFSGLDVTSAAVTRELVELLARRGKAILFSSPVLEQVEKLCSHLVLLKGGKVAASGPIAEMQSNFAGQSLEAGFMQLTEQVDIGSIASDLAAAVAAPLQ